MDEIRKRALQACKAPFDIVNGKIFDADANIFADDVAEEFVMRVRGWGRLSYMENPEQLQDEIGKMIVEALNDYWAKHTEIKSDHNE